MKTLDVKKLLDVGAALSREKDGDKLLEIILDAAMDITECDGGTLYISGEGCLQFRIMITLSTGFHKGGKDDPVELPPVPMSRSNVCACAAIDRTLINVADVYSSDRYDFSGPRNYDRLTGYRTQSMLVVPMENDYGEIIGVLQLINAKDESGEAIPFESGYEPVICSLASQAAICLTNMNYAVAIRETLDSFVRVMSTAIDARTPYNANHTRNMVQYADGFIAWLNENTDWKFSDAQRRQFLMSVWLHDVGKLVIPLEVMDKESRLGTELGEIRHRFREIGLLNDISLLKAQTDATRHDNTAKALDEGMKLIERTNTAGFLPDEALAELGKLAARTYADETGGVRPWLTPGELHSLSVRKGTLTDEERLIMQSHVEMTSKMLSEMEFSHDYEKVAQWAGEHHENLCGTGYPKKLTAADLCPEVRLLTILDIFDALTARDRPYKKPMPADKAFGILDSMVNEGQLDGEILELFKRSGAWRTDAAV